MPEELTEANVASIFKKGDTQNLANYRPISLLNTLYKIYASIIHDRISTKIDGYITETQYGFRKKRSTAHALYLARRIQDLAEQSGENIALVLLDWEKAFDKIDQSRMMEALNRLNIPRKIIANIEAIYEKPKFKVKDRDGESDFKEQSSGIRQGCPLSPYLFLLVMTVMFEDIHERIGRNIIKGKIDGLLFSEILYADDTLLVMKNTRDTNLLLKEIEIESSYYNMKLNNGKCEVIAMNKSNDIKFKDGTKLKHVREATYLGGKLTENTSASTEIQGRIAACIPLMKALDTFWKKTNCETKWKLNVFNAVILTKLNYGLETVQGTDSQFNKLDVFQMKGLRKILGIPPTHIDRTWTNEKVLEKANKEVGVEFPNPNNRKIKKVTHTLKLKRLSLLGHIIRADPNDPLKQVTFANESLDVLTPALRRVGRPRQKWTETTLKDAHEHFNYDAYTGSRTQNISIRKRAQDREPPFG